MSNYRWRCTSCHEDFYSESKFETVSPCCRVTLNSSTISAKQMCSVPGCPHTSSKDGMCSWHLCNPIFEKPDDEDVDELIASLRRYAEFQEGGNRIKRINIDSANRLQTLTTENKELQDSLESMDRNVLGAHGDIDDLTAQNKELRSALEHILRVATDGDKVKLPSIIKLAQTALDSTKGKKDE